MGCSSNMTPSQTLLPVSIEIEEKSGDLSTSCYTDCATQICYTDCATQTAATQTVLYRWDICCWGFSLPPVLVTSGYWKIFSPHFEKFLRLYFSTNKKPWSEFDPKIPVSAKIVDGCWEEKHNWSHNGYNGHNMMWEQKWDETQLDESQGKGQCGEWLPANNTSLRIQKYFRQISENVIWKESADS